MEVFKALEKRLFIDSLGIHVLFKLYSLLELLMWWQVVGYRPKPVITHPVFDVCSILDLRCFPLFDVIRSAL